MRKTTLLLLLSAVFMLTSTGLFYIRHYFPEFAIGEILALIAQWIAYICLFVFHICDKEKDKKKGHGDESLSSEEIE